MEIKFIAVTSCPISVFVTGGVTNELILTRVTLRHLAVI